jgi:YbbR domain-containing protein
MSENRNGINIQNYLKALRNGLKHLFLHNGWLKAIAIVISLVLWAGLISQDKSLTRDKTFQNVAVSVTGAESMKNNGYIVVSDMDEVLKDVTVTVAVPQQQYENAEASAYNVRLDLSRVKGIGEQEVKILSTNSSNYGKVISINPSSVTVKVEDYSIRQRIPVSASVGGEKPDGWSVSIRSVDPDLLAVSGPRSVVQTILRAKAVIDAKDIEWTEGTIVTGADIQLYDRAGQAVDNSLLKITSSSLTIDTVLVELNILPSASFMTEGLIQTIGKVAEGYAIKDIRVSPEVITVAARQEVLEQMNELSMERTAVNVDNLSETTVFQLKVQKPSDDSIISNDTVTVTVEIEEEP